MPLTLPELNKLFQQQYSCFAVSKVTLQQKQSRSKSLEYQDQEQRFAVGLKVQGRDTESVIDGSGL